MNNNDNLILNRCMLDLALENFNKLNLNIKLNS